MEAADEEILDGFFTLIQNIREILLFKRRELFDMIVFDKDKPLRDPFGRFFQIVTYLGERERATMSEFSAHFDLHGSTATGLIDQMVSRGLVERVSNPNDRRLVELVLTRWGQEVYTKALEIQQGEIADALGSLDEGDKRHLTRILEKVNLALTKSE